MARHGRRVHTLSLTISEGVQQLCWLLGGSSIDTLCSKMPQSSSLLTDRSPEMRQGAPAVCHPAVHLDVTMDPCVLPQSTLLP